MKIVSVMTTEAHGGAEFAVVELLDALVDRGHEAVLLTNLTELRRDRHVTVRQLDLGPKLSRSTYLTLLLHGPRLALAMRKALRRELPYDVLLVHFKKEQLFTLALPKRLRAACLWAEWGPLPREFRRGIPNKLYRAAACRARALLAVSDGTRDSLIAAGLPQDKVVVLPNAVRSDEIRFTVEGRSRIRAALDIPDGAFVVGLISRFHPKKRNDVVIEAAKRLGENVHLILAGTGETEESLRSLAGPLGDRAHFIPTPGTDVADVLSAFDVAVFCPSPTEGAPRAVILSMLAERPVVATGAEGVRHLIAPGTGVILSPENDPETLASTLERYVASSELCLQEGLSGRLHAESVHAAPAIAARFEQIVTEMGGSKDDAGHQYSPVRRD